MLNSGNVNKKALLVKRACKNQIDSNCLSYNMIKIIRYVDTLTIRDASA